MTAEAEHMVRFMKQTMLLLGYSNRDVERELGWASSSLSRLFSGQTELRFRHIVVIAGVIGLNPWELLRAAFPLPEGPPTEAFRRVKQSLGKLPAPPSVAVPISVSPEEEEELLRRMEKLVRRFLARMASALEKLDA